MGTLRSHLRARDILWSSNLTGPACRLEDLGSWDIGKQLTRDAHISNSVNNTLTALFLLLPYSRQCDHNKYNKLFYRLDFLTENPLTRDGCPPRNLSIQVDPPSQERPMVSPLPLSSNKIKERSSRFPNTKVAVDLKHHYTSLLDFLCLRISASPTESQLPHERTNRNTFRAYSHFRRHDTTRDSSIPAKTRPLSTHTTNEHSPFVPRRQISCITIREIGEHHRSRRARTSDLPENGFQIVPRRAARIPPRCTPSRSSSRSSSSHQPYSRMLFKSQTTVLMLIPSLWKLDLQSWRVDKLLLVEV